jgi:hypothetical protein
VILTTLTTILGLAPLLYETSQDAQFLKPTVITLVYGLGFGLVIVLLVVPALLAMQHDVARLVASVRRGARDAGRAGVVGLATGAAALGAAAVFAGTVGSVMLTGRLLPPLGGLLPDASTATAFLLFAAGTAAVTLVVWLVSSALIARGKAAA